jgi:hypothetical protein
MQTLIGGDSLDLYLKGLTRSKTGFGQCYADSGSLRHAYCNCNKNVTFAAVRFGLVIGDL